MLTISITYIGKKNCHRCCLFTFFLFMIMIRLFTSPRFAAHESCVWRCVIRWLF